MKTQVNPCDLKGILSTDWSKIYLSGRRKTIVKVKDQRYRYLDGDSKTIGYSYDQFIGDGKNSYEALVLSLLSKNIVCNIKYSKITSTLSVKLSCGKTIIIKLNTKDIIGNLDKTIQAIINNYCENRFLLTKELFQKNKDIVIDYDGYPDFLGFCESGVEEYDNRYVFKLINDDDKLNDLKDYEFLINLIKELVQNVSQKVEAKEKNIIVNIKQRLEEEPEFNKVNVEIVIDLGSRKIEINDPTPSLIEIIYDIINEHNKMIDESDLDVPFVKKNKNNKEN